MDFREKSEFLPERGEDDHICLHESDTPSDWRFDNPQVGFLTSNLVQCCQDHEIQIAVSSSPSSASMVGSLPICGGAINLQEPSFSNVAVPLNSILPPPGLDLRWNPLEVIPKGVAFSQNGFGVFPPSPSRFPADSAFIEHAVRVSCFNGVGVGGAANPFRAYGSSVPFSIAHKNDDNVGKAADGVSMPVEKPAETATGDDSIVHDDFSVGGQDEAPIFDKNAGEPPSMGFSARKKERGNQGSQDQAERNNQISVENLRGNAEVKTKEEQHNSSSPASKPSGKYGKDTAETPKEDYVHVRARHGQATNSHSLAERVRRERINERMKFLQDLVPGCSKVTGKAVMLDEIINYVQSLQRQVEFLSMKLAAVNPPLDVNVEQLLSKEILRSRTISSSMLGFSSDVLDPQLHLTPQAFGQPGFSVIRNPSYALKAAVHTQLNSMNAYREQPNQISTSWDNKLQSVVQMEFGGNAPHGIQELHGLPRPGHMKAEP